MTVDTSSQQALAGLGYLLMQSALDGAITATPFIPAAAPDAPVSTNVDTELVCVDLHDRSDLTFLSDAYLPEGPADTASREPLLDTTARVDEVPEAEPIDEPEVTAEPLEVILVGQEPDLDTSSHPADETDPHTVTATKHEPAPPVEYRQGGYRGDKSGSLLSELDFLE